MVISNFLCGPSNWQIETARTIDREIQQRIALKSMQRLRRDEILACLTEGMSIRRTERKRADNPGNKAFMPEMAQSWTGWPNR